MLGRLFTTTEFPMAATALPSANIDIISVSIIIAITTDITIATISVATTTTTATVIITTSCNRMERLALNCAPLGIQKCTLHRRELNGATNSSRHELLATQVTLDLKAMPGQKMFVSHFCEDVIRVQLQVRK